MRIPVTFEGDGAGEAPLSWGQQDIWVSMRRFGEQLPLGGVSALPPGTTVEDVAAELRYLMGRYQVLRTRLRLVADGPPRQVVAASGTVELEVLDDEDPLRMLERYRRDTRDFSVDWPIRMGVVRRHGVPSHLCSVVWHLAMDRGGAAVMLREVAARVDAPVGGLQPLAQARWQASEAGERQTRAALRHWERTLRAMPPPWPASSTRAERPRHWKGRLVSHAIPLATRAVVARTGADQSTALLAAFAAAVARCGRVGQVLVLVVTHNRFRPGLADVVAPVAQPGLCVLDVSDPRFEVVLTEARRASTVAYKHAYYDTASRETLTARIEAERGPQFRVDCHLNDRRRSPAAEATRKDGEGRGTDGTPPAVLDSGTLSRAVARRSLEWVPFKESASSRLFIHVDDDERGAAVLTCYADTRFISLAAASAVLTTLEAVLVDAAAGG